MILMVLEELYLLLSLREDEGNIDGHQKKVRGIEGLLEKKSSTFTQYDSFMEMRVVSEGCWRCSKEVVQYHVAWMPALKNNKRLLCDILSSHI
jgi:hypothetical protein